MRYNRPANCIYRRGVNGRGPVWGTVIPNVTPRISSLVESLRILPRQLLPSSARIRYPTKDEKGKFAKLAEKVDEHVIKAAITQLTDILTSESRLIFGYKRCPKRNLSNEVGSPQIFNLKAQIKTLGGIIHICKNPSSNRVSRETRNEYEQRMLASAELSHEDLLGKVREERRKLYKELYRARARAAWNAAKKFDSSRMYTALKGGSTKKLNLIQEYSEMPLALNYLENPDGISFDTTKIYTDPDRIKNITSTYFRNLYGPHQVPEGDRPWLRSESVLKIKEDVESDPIEWPIPATLETFKALLRRGNQRPSPDRWERWTVRALSDRSMSIVKNLFNYIVMNNYFPQKLKETS